jgi:GNAT superfamily N-acetyltransferase
VVHDAFRRAGFGRLLGQDIIGFARIDCARHEVALVEAAVAE